MIKLNPKDLRPVAFLTCEDVKDFVIDDELLIRALDQRGIKTEMVIWDKPQSWPRFQAVLIRTTWDYTKKLGGFLNVLSEIERLQVPLIHSLDIVKWNCDKVYLRELQNKGVETLPTLWANEVSEIPLTVLSLRAQIADTPESWILKPTVSANADNTFLIASEDWETWMTKNRRSLMEKDKKWMIQPFLKSIQNLGEISLHYFGNQFSHAIRKRPKSGDFRVQEEHGGQIDSIQPNPNWVNFGYSVLNKLNWPTTYARVDFVENESGMLLLMELELIEPSLYFRTDSLSADRFAEVLINGFF